MSRRSSRSPSSFFARPNRNSGYSSSFFSSSQRRDAPYADPSSDILGAPDSRPIRRSASTTASTRADPDMPASSVRLRGMQRLEKRRTMEEKNFLQSKARAQNLNPPVDLRMLDFVSPYDENLMCPICRCPFVDPVVLNECDHCFCRDCIRQTWSTANIYSPHGPRGDCPTCRTPAKLGARSSTTKILTNILDDLVVKCPKSDEGCTAEVKRGEIQDHMTIYCGYALVECMSEDCDRAVRRKDAEKGCLHVGVSCISCRKEMQVSKLEQHWRTKCPDRLVSCNLCKSLVQYREFDEHSQNSCSAMAVLCPGASIGCTVKSKRADASAHAESCTFAKLAPVIAAQTSRIDAQEAAQKQMSRKLEVLENGFFSMQSILYPRHDDPNRNSADSGSIPLTHAGFSDDDEATAPSHPNFIPLPAWQNERPFRHRESASSVPEEHIFTTDFDLASPFPPPAADSPYASPLHHLLSMHEALRDEMSRLSTSLQDLEGRTQMQSLNENLRTREEITYVGAQVAGLARQVHWLTSAQLQRQGGSGRSGTPGAEGGVGEAISSAVRGAARIVSAGANAAGSAGAASAAGGNGSGMIMRRGPSEEGRTKL